MNRWLFIPFLIIPLIVFDTILAWYGSQAALLMLAVTAAGLAVAFTLSGHGWREALNGWGRSTAGWAAAQSWGMKQDVILRDVLRELHEYDEEAAVIHQGRSMDAGLEYIHTFDDVDYS